MKEIILKGKNFQNLNIKSVFFDESFYNELSKQKTKEGGNYLDLIASGKGIRGFKHLIEVLLEKDPKAKIIFTHDVTKKSKNNWYINLNDYKKSAAPRFFKLYRETGLDGAMYYLSQKIPDHFSYDTAIINENNLKMISKNIPEVFKKISQKRKDKDYIISKTADIITELGRKKKKLKQEIDSLEKIKLASNIASMLNDLNKFELRLSKKYSETSGKNSWQKWLKNHSWMFGVYYNEPYEKNQVGFSSIPDYLFPTIDGFIDIYEIKLPSHDIIKADTNHSGSFMWSGKANEAISQCVNYLHEIELHQLLLVKNIEKAYNVKLSFIKPRAFVIIGDKSKLNTEDEKEALRKLNYSLHGIEVLTYNDLKDRGHQILKISGYKE